MAPWSIFKRAIAGIIFVGSCALSAMVDPSDFLLGSLHRPRLQILHPNNGQVLDNGDLRIEIKVAGYDMPSHLHSSKICIGISTGLDFTTEQCFQQTDVVFHANGLTAGTQYALRVVLLERGQALAVSVRHFRVGGIRGVPKLAEVLTIKTAVQVAVQYHNSGLDTEAETIYRQVLAENPLYPDALHLLGMVFYQKGDLLSAAEYVERALLNAGPNSVQSYHSTLGACYKRLGRLAEAEEQFRQVLRLSPYDPVAMFNLGLVLQEQGQHQWMHAVTLFRNATRLSQRESPASAGQNVLSEEAREQAKVRECDILYALRRYQEGLDCWQHASTLFPRSSVVFNELGGVLASMGEMERAIAAYRTALSLGKHSAQVNIALLLEQLGYDNEARSALDEAIAWARSHGLPVYHLLLRQATILARVMPAETGAIDKLRNDHLRALELVVTSSEREVDNGSPVHMTYSLGYHYLFHGALDDRELKQRLARAYLSLCPALLQGVFLESTASLQTLLPALSHSTSEATAGATASIAPTEGSSASATESSAPTEPTRVKLRLAFLSRFFCYHSVGLLVGGLVETLHTALHDEVEVHLVVVEGGAGSVYHDSLQQYILGTTPHVHYLPNPADLTGSIAFVRGLHLDVLVFPEQALDPLTYFMSFARSAPVQAVMLVHPSTSGVPSVDYFITAEEVQGLEAQSQYSETLVPLPGLSSRLLDLHRPQAVAAYYRPDSVAAVRSEVLAGLGLPANTHLYVVPHSPVRIHPSFDAVLVKLLVHDKLATIVFCDPAVPRVSWQQHLLARVLNTSAEVLPAGTGTASSPSRAQLLFANISSAADMLRMLQAASVVLEPFPATGNFIPSLDALSLGVPVVTLPLKPLGGRLTLALYRLMGYGEKAIAEVGSVLYPPDLPPPDDLEDLSAGLAARGAAAAAAARLYSPLVVSSASEYVTVAMKIAHQPALRDYHSHQLLWRRHRLFQAPPQLASRWRTFLFEARANHSTSQVVAL